MDDGKADCSFKTVWVCVVGVSCFVGLLFGAKFGLVLTVDNDRSVDFSPGVNLGNVTGFHVNATVGHGGAKVVVPVGSV